ncbi:phosphotransferase [Spiroplasma endosymbiont of Anurida maritima]|uniref:phosphotransferase n=1 Tax=Spiroplasma endosymbiont of Anurida maritima TaxID=2967972 RepID=UPI0036D3FCC2
MKISNQGLTNKILIDTKNNLFIKESINNNIKFLFKKNQEIFWNISKNDFKTLRPVAFSLKNDSYWEKYTLEKDIKNLYEVKITKKIIEDVFWEINKLHKIKTNGKISIFNPKEYLNIFIKEISNDKQYSIINEMVKNINWQKLEDSQKSENLVISHNDLNRNNIVLLNSKIMIIDFEFVTINSKYFDIASFMSESLVELDDINYWIQLGNYNELEKEYINAWVYYQNVLWSAWALYCFKITNKEIFLDIYNEKIKKLTS